MIPAAMGGGLYRQYLQQGRDAVCLGDVVAGWRLARQALGGAIAAKNISVEGEAALLMAHACVLESRLETAHLMATRANQLFVQDSNEAGQAEALAILSFTDGARGRNGSALQAATASLALRRDAGQPLAQAYGLNYLGVAAIWSRDFGTAKGSLEAAVWFAGKAAEPAAGFQPLVNLGFLELLRMTETEGEASDQLAQLEQLEQLVQKARAFANSRSPAILNPAMQAVCMLLLEFMSCLVASRHARLQEADACYLACLKRAASLPHSSWGQAMLWWARAERAAAHGDIETCGTSLQTMAESAGQHVQIHGLARMLQASLQPPLNQSDSGYH